MLRVKNILRTVNLLRVVVPYHDDPRANAILLGFTDILRFLPILDCTDNLERRGKNPLEENILKKVEKSPRNCRFLSLVVVERALLSYDGSQPHQGGKCSVVQCNATVPSALCGRVAGALPQGRCRATLAHSAPECTNIAHRHSLAIFHCMLRY